MPPLGGANDVAKPRAAVLRPSSRRPWGAGAPCSRGRRFHVRNPGRASLGGEHKPFPPGSCPPSGVAYLRCGLHRRRWGPAGSSGRCPGGLCRSGCSMLPAPGSGRHAGCRGAEDGGSRRPDGGGCCRGGVGRGLGRSGLGAGCGLGRRGRRRGAGGLRRSWMPCLTGVAVVSAEGIQVREGDGLDRAQSPPAPGTPARRHLVSRHRSHSMSRVQGCQPVR